MNGAGWGPGAGPAGRGSRIRSGSPAACRWRPGAAGAAPPGAGSSGPAVPAERCSQHVRAAASRWCLWSVPTDVTARSVPIAKVGALAVVEADGTLLICSGHCRQNSEESLERWDGGVAQCHGQVRGIFVFSVFIPLFWPYEV